MLKFYPIFSTQSTHRNNDLLINLVIILIIIFITKFAYAENLFVLENKNIKILFEKPLLSAAKNIVEIYPEIKASLEKDIEWNLRPRPTVLLIKDSKRFHKMGAPSLSIAFAVPRSHMIVIDYTKMTLHPLTLKNTMKHEMCHLLLNQHIKGQILPRWLDEGICQWVSDGMVDIIMDQKRSFLNKAALRGTFIRLNSLQHGFPYEKDYLLLAYEESKSFVAHIISRYGRDEILNILEHMKNGRSVEQAFQHALSISLEELELKWHDSLRQKATWFIHLSYYLYEILFGFMAIISIFAFIKLILKKRAYMMENDDENLLS